MKAFVLTIILCIPVLFQFRHQIFPGAPQDRAHISTDQLAARAQSEYADLMRRADQLKAGPYTPGAYDEALKLREQVKLDFSELTHRGVDVGPIEEAATRDAGHTD